MAQTKAKPLLPTLRERKRYLAFEVQSETPISGTEAQSQILAEAYRFLGELDMAEAGIWYIDEKWDAKKQRGIFRVADTHLDKLRAVLTLVDRMKNQEVLVRSIGASGMISTAAERYIAG